MPKEVMKETVRIDAPSWLVAPRPLSETEKLNAKLADLEPEEAGRLTSEELEQAAETAWALASQQKFNLGS